MCVKDWTKPVETTEDPPRPVRVLATDLDSSRWPVAVAIPCTDEGDMEVMCFSHEGSACDDNIRFTLRNAPPPKPEPVMYEKWVLLEKNGDLLDYRSESQARDAEDEDTAEVRRIAWMSDGSPVRDDAMVGYHQHLMDVISERGEWKAKAEEALRLLQEQGDKRDAAIARAEAAEVARSQLRQAKNDRIIREKIAAKIP